MKHPLPRYGDATPALVSLVKKFKQLKQRQKQRIALLFQFLDNTPHTN